MEITCADCKSVLPNEKDECKKCGSNKKDIKLYFKKEIDIRGCYNFKVKDKTRNSKKNPVLNVFRGDEICKSTGEWVNKERVIDKKNNRYYEHVETFDGKELRHCDEKLTDHLGHGSAKIRR